MRASILCPGKGCLGTVHLQLVTVWVDIDGDAPAMHGPFRAAAHLADVETAAEQIQAQGANLRLTVMGQRILKHPQEAIMHLGVAGEAADDGSFLSFLAPRGDGSSPESLRCSKRMGSVPGWQSRMRINSAPL